MGSFREMYNDLTFFNLFNTYTAKPYTLTGSYSCWESVINSYRVLVGQKPTVYYKSKLIEYGIHATSRTSYWTANNHFGKDQKQNYHLIYLPSPFSPLKSISFQVLVVSVFAAALLKRSSAKLQESTFFKSYILWRCEIAKKIICWQTTHILYILKFTIQMVVHPAKVLIKWYNNVLPSLPQITWLTLSNFGSPSLPNILTCNRLLQVCVEDFWIHVHQNWRRVCRGTRWPQINIDRKSWPITPCLIDLCKGFLEGV